jgi:hypothetical protein
MEEIPVKASGPLKASGQLRPSVLPPGLWMLPALPFGRVLIGDAPRTRAWLSTVGRLALPTSVTTGFMELR